MDHALAGIVSALVVVVLVEQIIVAAAEVLGAGGTELGGLLVATLLVLF